MTLPTNIVIWNLYTKILFILGHTDNDKDRLQHQQQQQTCLVVAQCQRGLVRKQATK